MKARTTTWLAWSLWALSVSLAVGDLGLAFLNRTVTRANSIGLPGQMAILGAITATVGALVASRRPRNAVGWLFCVLGLGLVLSILSQDYAIRALVSAPGSLPGGEFMAWLGSWLPAAGGVATFLMLLFPTGRLPSQRWRPVAWAAALDSFVLATAVAWLTAPPGTEDLHGFNGPETFGEGTMGALLGSSFLVAVLTAIAAAIAVLLRLKRARGDERQQLKWFVYAATALVVAVLVSNIPTAVVPSYLAPNVIVLVSFGGIPIAAAIAILKYRLYDIDIIINRTLVYGALTAVLTLVYVAGVAGVGGLVRAATGQDKNNIVVAASTLAVAALFRPARSRIQAFIDRSFYRRKYDAVRTLEHFSARLREEIDLDSLSTELLGVVQDTMQPAQISLWLREREGRTRQPA